MPPIYKFGYLDKAGVDLPYQYDNSWARQKTSGPDRLVIAPASRHVDLLFQLTEVMHEPYGLLYVLQVPRNDVDPAGRYQNPEPISRADLGKFLQRFSSFLENDGRHHFWIGSADKSATLVYDRHDVLYAYGPLDLFEGILLRNNLHKADTVSFPGPHVHHYNQQFDQEARELMNYWQWIKYPLQGSDI